jgi:hypothetical protein
MIICVHGKLYLPSTHMILTHTSKHSVCLCTPLPLSHTVPPVPHSPPFPPSRTQKMVGSARQARGEQASDCLCHCPFPVLRSRTPATEGGGGGAMGGGHQSPRTYRGILPAKKSDPSQALLHLSLRLHFRPRRFRLHRRPYRRIYADQSRHKQRHRHRQRQRQRQRQRLRHEHRDKHTRWRTEREMFTPFSPLRSHRLINIGDVFRGEEVLRGGNVSGPGDARLGRFYRPEYRAGADLVELVSRPTRRW